ncbi:MAG TPA: MraY family glycosyltransferase [Chitinophagaceae bacterium]|jgi:UDP-N-acetylmuramyl pentapeptide phosphotransferase/UDP-N-acetylglucosamine-1-phosphate transferase|nr:MraY family glycosyltransferase [Chitinophagaceae bacterium]
MLNVLLTGSLAFIITFLAIPMIMKVAEAKKLYDLPDARKLHTRPIASLGGVGIFGGFFLAALLSISHKITPEFQYFFAASTIIFFLGVKDDILILTATKKMVGQIAAAAILIHLGNIRIDSMHGVFGVTELPEAFSLALSYITIILIINAFNLIDGVDGLAGMLGLLSTSVFGMYFYLIDLQSYALLSFAMAGSLVAFLIFNYHPAKIFMGDSGSLLLGLINAILVIKFIQVAESGAVAFPIQSAVAVGMSILMIPLMDTLRVFSIRIFRGRSPFAPDRNHIHHLLLARGLNHQYVTLTCLLLNAAFIGMAYFSRSLGPTYVLGGITAICFSFLGVVVYYRNAKKPATVAKSFTVKEHHLPVQPATKVVSITNEPVAAVEQ